MVIFILGIKSAVAIPKFINLVSSAKLSAARGVGSAILCNTKDSTFGWTWTTQTGDTPVLIVEDSTTAFP